MSEGWNGSQWKVNFIPKRVEALANVLSSVSCSSSTTCSTVGVSLLQRPLRSEAFVSHLSGSKWSIDPGLEQAKVSSTLESVSCTSSVACLAVGSSESGTLVASWNGTEWLRLSIPSLGEAKGSRLQSISCSSSVACTATGYYGNKSSVRHPFAERWNGSEWQPESPPTPFGAKESDLTGISCSSVKACMAIGNYKSNGIVEAPLAETWNGVEWAIRPVAKPAGAKTGRY